MLQMRGGDKRLYSPDRDLIWALPRMIRNATVLMGSEITVEHVRKMLADRNITYPGDDEQLYTDLEQLLSGLGKFFNAMRDDKEARKHPEEWFKQLFAEGPVSALRVLITDLLFCVMTAELPIWFESVQPKHEGESAPDVGEVQDAVDAILRQLHGVNDG